MIKSVENFLAMNPAFPNYSEKNQHYYMSGVNPTYYLDTAGVQEVQLAPLVASVAWTKGSFFNLSVDDIVPSISNSYDAYAVGSDSTVYGVNAASGAVSSFGFPSGSSSISGDHRIACFANQVIISIAGIGGAGLAELYTMALPGGGGFTGITSLTGTVHHLEPFSLYLLVSSGSQVQRLTTSLSLIGGIDFGTGWTVQNIKNYDDKYASIAVTQGNFDYSFLALWDGSSPFANFKVKVPGRFLDQKVINGILYVAVWENGGLGTNIRTSVYKLNSTTLQLETSPIVSNISVPTNNQNCIFNFSNKVGVLLNNTDLFTYGKRNVGLEEFVLSTGIPFDHFSETSGGYLIGTALNPSTGNTDLYSYIQTATIYNKINYISQWMPSNAAGAIDIFYDTPPQSGTDSINVTIYGKGENIPKSQQNIPIVLNPINVSTIVSDVTPISQYRTRLDLQGFTGSQIKITISTINSTWRPIIRGYQLIDSIMNK